MAKLYSPALLYEKNRLESDHVWTFLFQVDIPGAPVPYRLAAYDQDVIFHGLSFVRFPCEIDSLEDPTSAALVSLRLTIGNVTQEMSSLLEQYWASVPDPAWRVAIYEVDSAQPDQTPFEAASLYTVTSVTTDFRSARVELQAEGLSLTTTIPKRRFTSSSGFSNIPRRN